MATPTFNLPTSSSDPKRATKEGLEENINQIIQYLDNARISGDAALMTGLSFQGGWDASTGLFPAQDKDGGSISVGDFFWVSVEGTFGGTTYAINEPLVSLVDNPSTSNPNDWFHTELNPSLVPINSRVSVVESAVSDLEGVNNTKDLFNLNQGNPTFAPRNVADLLNPFMDTSGLQDRVVLKKLRPDYGECAVYRHAAEGSTEWTRTLFSSRFNSGLGGLPRHVLTTVASLYKTNTTLKYAANNISESRGSSTTVTRASSDGVTVGTWSAPADTLGTTDVTRSSTVGDTITFTITGVERIELRGLLAGNGGIGKVTIETGGVEIAEGNYLLPSDHLVDFISTATGNTTMHIPLAEGLSSSSTYSVEIEVHTSNPSGNRVYVAGLLGFDSIAFDAVGVHGTVIDASLGGQTNSMSIMPGTRLVYEVSDATKADWSYVQTPVGSIVTFLVYDSTGSLVLEESFDQYAVGSTAKKEEVFRDLTLGTYYIHVVNGKVKNPLATNYRVYDYGFSSYDQEVSGVVGVDSFDDKDVPSNITDPNQGSSWVLLSNGNIEYAPRVTKVGEPTSGRTFLGGIHGHEVLNSITYYVDGIVVDYAGSVAGAEFVAQKEIKMVANTTLNFASDDSSWANVDTTMSMTKRGYSVKVKITTVTDAVVFDDFSMMLVGPNTDTSGGTYGTSQGGDTGGGFELVALDENYVVNNYDGSGISIENPNRSMAMVNGDYALVCAATKTSELPDLFRTSDFSAGSGLGLIQDRIDNTVKGYIRTFVVGASGATVPSGTTWTTTKHYRTFKGDFNSVVGG